MHKGMSYDQPYAIMLGICWERKLSNVLWALSGGRDPFALVLSHIFDQLTQFKKNHRILVHIYESLCNFFFEFCEYYIDFIYIKLSFLKAANMSSVNSSSRAVNRFRFNCFEGKTKICYSYTRHYYVCVSST